MYDITNVLEGVGLIVKESKNNIRWVPSRDGGSAAALAAHDPEIDHLRADMSDLEVRAMRHAAPAPCA